MQGRATTKHRCTDTSTNTSRILGGLGWGASGRDLAGHRSRRCRHLGRWGRPRGALGVRQGARTRVDLGLRAPTFFTKTVRCGQSDNPTSGLHPVLGLFQPLLIQLSDGCLDMSLVLAPVQVSVHRKTSQAKKGIGGGARLGNMGDLVVERGLFA